ncbi:MAG: sucrase ferredoxin [Polyangiaceae bacterium]
MQTADPSLPCTRQSLSAGEPIAGSAIAEAQLWLLIEHRGRWERDLAETPLPEATRAWLDGLTKRYRRLKPLLIRKPMAEGPLNVIVARMAPPAKIRRFQAADLEAVADLDLRDLLDGERDAGEPAGPLFLVCTHGRRDVCCSRHGIALFKTLADSGPPGSPPEVWQTTHQGGHRFAATMVHLPSGVHYGRLMPEDAELVVAAHARGEVYELSRYRGQTRYARPVQAAEAWLRQELEEPRLDAIGFLDHSLLDQASDRWIARFRAPGDLIHRVTVERREGRILRMASCEGAEPEAPTYYVVVRHEAQTTG